MKLRGRFTVLLGLTALALSSSQALALTTLRKVQVTDGSQINLFFDKEIGKNQIRTEFFRDIIQISLNGVSVYPAKITSVSGTELKKVFAYQYTPKTTRCRLTIDGSAEEFQDRVQVEAKGKLISIRIKEPKKIDQIAHSAAKSMSTSEEALLERVKKGEPAKQEIAEGDKPIDAVASEGESEERLTTSKPLPSPFRAFGALGLILLVFAAAVAVLRKAKKSGIKRHKGIGGILAKMGGISGTNNQMVEIISNHHLGPKKSIAVARIGGRTMVLGVTDESINLITEIADDGASSFEEMGEGPKLPSKSHKGSGAIAGTKSSQFSEILGVETAKPSVRAQIKSRLEGFKPL